jgi:hypothetical protein
MIAMWKSQCSEDVDEYRLLDNVKVALMACCPPPAIDLINSLGPDRSSISLADMMKILKVNYGSPGPNDIREEVASLSYQFKAGDNMLSHVAKMRRTITLLASHGAPLSELESVNHLLTSVSKVPELALTVSTYNLSHRAISQADFDDLASMLVSQAEAMPSKPARLNAVVEVSPLGQLYAAQRASRSRSGSPAQARVPSLSSPEYLAIYKAAQALPAPTGFTAPLNRSGRPSSPHPRGGTTSAPYVPRKNPAKSDHNSLYCTAHGWNATHKTTECRYVKRQTAPA